MLGQIPEEVAVSFESFHIDRISITSNTFPTRENPVLKACAFYESTSVPAGHSATVAAPPEIVIAMCLWRLTAACRKLAPIGDRKAQYSQRRWRVHLSRGNFLQQVDNVGVIVARARRKQRAAYGEQHSPRRRRRCGTP